MRAPTFLRSYSTWANDMMVEVLLSLLLANFTFELSDKRIVWNFGGVRYPSVGQKGGESFSTYDASRVP